MFVGNTGRPSSPVCSLFSLGEKRTHRRVFREVEREGLGGWRERRRGEEERGREHLPKDVNRGENTWLLLLLFKN